MAEVALLNGRQAQPWPAAGISPQPTHAYFLGSPLSSFISLFVQTARDKNAFLTKCEHWNV